jgi:hypothetical protein
LNAAAPGGGFAQKMTAGPGPGVCSHSNYYLWDTSGRGRRHSAQPPRGSRRADGWEIGGSKGHPQGAKSGSPAPAHTAQPCHIFGLRGSRPRDLSVPARNPPGESCRVEQYFRNVRRRGAQTLRPRSGGPFLVFRPRLEGRCTSPRQFFSVPGPQF